MRLKCRYGFVFVLLTVYLLANKGGRSLGLLARLNCGFLAGTPAGWWETDIVPGT
jgi:hypothetical protein